MRCSLLLSPLVALLALAPAVHADTLYTYAGDTFRFVVGGEYTTSDRITASFTTSRQFIYDDIFLAPSERSALILRYSISDGVRVLTDQNSALDGRLPSYVDSPFGWSVDVQGAEGGIHTDYVFGGGTDYGFRGGSSCSPDDLFLGICSSAGFLAAGLVPNPYAGHHGTWTIETVPEPATLFFVGSGLIGLGTVLWRLRRTMAP